MSQAVEGTAGSCCRFSGTRLTKHRQAQRDHDFRPWNRVTPLCLEARKSILDGSVQRQCIYDPSPVVVTGMDENCVGQVLVEGPEDHLRQRLDRCWLQVPCFICQALEVVADSGREF